VETFFGETPFSGKCLPFEKIQVIFVLKCTQVPTDLIHPCLSVNQRSNELRLLVTVRVGMFSQNEYLLKNTLAVLCLKIQEEGYGPPYPLSRHPCPYHILHLKSILLLRWLIFHLMSIITGSQFHFQNFLVLFCEFLIFLLLYLLQSVSLFYFCYVTRKQWYRHTEEVNLAVSQEIFYSTLV